ncbi:hypothetical protein [Marinibacterium sp. SX1]|uniref:hypothetical protein n=1 Tax=Marinibacterium sp. SX1 TaxID=3388424 RepID=UPI003D167845
MTKRIHLHAGAHRTGSSSFQMCLYDNRAALGRHGYDLAYPGRDGVPDGRLRLRLPGPRHGIGRLGRFAGSVRDAVARFSPDPARQLVLSEENIPGRMFHFYQGQFFPAAAKRFRAFRAGIGAADLHVVYVLRSYDELYASAYRKRAEDNAVDPFAGLVPHFLAMDRGWPELVADMQAELKPAQLTLVSYENRGKSIDLLTRLLPDMPREELVEPQAVLNLSATDAALEALQAGYRAGETLTRTQWQEIVRSHADDRGSRGFAQFDAAARQALRDRYHADLDRIRAMPGLRLD